MMRPTKDRDNHFRDGFKMRPSRDNRFREGFKIKPTRPKVRGFKHPTTQGRVGICYMLYLFKFATVKALAAECRTGRLPWPRRDITTRELFWSRLEIEALHFWRRSLRARRRTAA